MESPKIVYRYYSNPAFCAQSEVVFSSTAPCVSAKITPNRRMSPLGANSPRKNPEKHSNRIKRTDISDNPLRIAPSGIMREDSPPELPPKPAKFQSNFYRQSSMIVKPTARATRSRTRSEDLEMAQIRQRKYQRDAESDDGLEEVNIYSKHRYEVIAGDLEDLADFSPTKKRIVEADAEDIHEYNVDGPDENEMKEIPTEIVKTVNGKTQRYAIVPLDDEEPQRKPTVTFSPPKMSKKNLIATQKLHELLSTPPRHLKSYGSQPSIHVTPNKASPNRYVTKKIVSSTPTKVLSSSKSLANLSRDISKTSPISPKAQQKLHYGVQDNDREDVFVRSFREVHLDDGRRERESDRRLKKDKSMAVIVPRIAPPPSDSDDTYKSWMNMKQVSAATASLAVAALMMTLCGGLSAGLSFYMMYSVGRRYYLDFGALSGFTCLLLGILGFRSRKYTLLPNRNYISGYIVLSTFSILSAIGLLILLILEPQPGTPPNDVTSGAVCGLSLLSLTLTSIGVITSYCCRHPPQDNRVDSVKWY